MLKKLARVMGLSGLLLSATTQALPIVQADAFIAGDNKAALETATGLVWMDFGVNNHYSYTQVVGLLSTEYAGWRLPTANEVNHLWVSLFDGLPEWFQSTAEAGSLSFTAGFLNSPAGKYEDLFNQIYEILGQGPDSRSEVYDEHGNLVESWTSKSAFGIFMKDADTSGFVHLENPYSNAYSDSAMYVEMYLTDISYWHGTLLVKDDRVSVPEPAAPMLALLGLMALFARRQLRR